MGKFDGILFVRQIQQIVKDTLRQENSNYIRVVPAKVISVSDGNAVVRLAYASQDGNEDFSVPIITSQTVVAGDAVNIAYWSSLSTAILISKG